MSVTFNRIIMNKLYSYKWNLLVLAILLILVLVRNSDPHVFKVVVKEAIASSADSHNLITVAQLTQLSTPLLIVDLGVESEHDSLNRIPSVKIPFEQLLNPVNRKILNEAKGGIVLTSREVATASRAWVILNQLGYQKVWILTPNGDGEAFKYKFQPDTTARLENDSI